jgi:hypothetical protein
MSPAVMRGLSDANAILEHDLHRAPVRPHF